MPSVLRPNSQLVTDNGTQLTNTGALFNEYSNSYTVKWTDSVTRGENLKGWQELLRRGENATTSLSGQRSEIRLTPGTFSCKASGPAAKDWTTTARGMHRIDPGLPSDPADLSEAKSDARALGKFATKIVNAQSSIQGGVVLGEIGQTLSMIKNPARGLRRLVDVWHDAAHEIRAARRLKTAVTLTAHKKAVAQNLADAWLEYSFGWRPFLSDVKDGVTTLSKYKTGQSHETRRISARSVDEQVYSTFSNSHTFGHLRWKTEKRSVGSVTTIYRGAVRVESRDPKEMTPSLLGFSPEQFLPTAWELVPYSFLIDYFTNIGDIIYGWSSIVARVAWVNKTVRRVTEEKGRAFTSNSYLAGGFPTQNPALTVRAGAKSVATRTRVSRVKYEGTTVPDFTFEMPSFSSQKWLNIAALIASRDSDRSWFYD